MDLAERGAVSAFTWYRHTFNIFNAVARRRVEAQMQIPNKLAATLQLMDVQLTAFPGVEYDGKLLKGKFEAMLDNYVQHIRSRAVEGQQRLLAQWTLQCAHCTVCSLYSVSTVQAGLTCRRAVAFGSKQRDTCSGSTSGCSSSG